MAAPADQRNEAFTEPAFADIPAISRGHVAAMESSDAEEVWTAAGMSHVLIYTNGRRTGKKHAVALPFWLDPDGHRIVVASYAGARNHPAWYLNLADRAANPDVLVRVRGRRFVADAEILDGAEYERIWALLTADRPYYNDYQTRTPRTLPLVRLREQRPA
jgi:deazaflavin-dependent oxidoreductase (nitroreductase family)